MTAPGSRRPLRRSRDGVRCGAGGGLRAARVLVRLTGAASIGVALALAGASPASAQAGRDAVTARDGRPETPVPTAASIEAECGDRPNQSAMNECVAAARRQADAALKRTLDAVLARLDPTRAQGLRDAQRVWARFRDAQCRFESAGVEGGSLRPFVQGSCVVAMTRSRELELQRLLRCPEGDAACAGRR